MLWTNEQRRRILAGEITATVRAWERPQVIAGKRYRFDDEHDFVVHSLARVERDALTAADLAASGFETEAAFEQALPKFARDRTGGPFFVVHFTLEPMTPAAADPADVDKLAARLRKLDATSDHGPWTRDALAVIAANPRVVSTELARQVGRERFAFKSDVRKLKRLGLTRSHDVGYEVTELGRAVLDAVDREASPAATERIPTRDSPTARAPSPRARGEGAGGEGAVRRAV